MRQRRKCRQADQGLGNDARTRTSRAVEHPRRKLLPASPIGAVQRATEINAIRLRNRRMDMNVQAKPRMPPIENFADNSPVGVLKPCWTTRAGRNTVRPHTSLGYRPPAPEVFVPAFAAWPAALTRPAPPARLTLAQRPTL